MAVSPDNDDVEQRLIAVRGALMNVRGYGQLLQRQLRVPRANRERLAEYADGLTDEVTRLGLLIEDLAASINRPVEDRQIAPIRSAPIPDD